MAATHIKKLGLVACLACSIGFSAQAIAATSLGTGSDNYAGLVTDGAPANAANEIIYINTLIDQALGSSTTIDGELYERSLKPCTPNLGGCPDALLTGAVKDDTNPLLTFDVTGYEWLLAKYDGQNYGSAVWFIGNLTGEVTIPGTLGGYGLSHWSLYNANYTPPCTNGNCGGEEIPEPGTLLLLGAGLTGLALMRRRRRA